MLGVAAAVTLACRLGGYLLMAYLPASPRLAAALRATPIGVMVGIVMPALSSGLWQVLSLFVVFLFMRQLRDETIAALAGVAVIAACRWVGVA